MRNETSQLRPLQAALLTPTAQGAVPQSAHAHVEASGYCTILCRGRAFTDRYGIAIQPQAEPGEVDLPLSGLSPFLLAR